MSMIFSGRGKDNFMMFTEYLLSESISPIEADYGINKTLNDRNWTILDHPSGSKLLHYTFTKIEGLFYMVAIQSTGEIGFGTSKDINLNRIREFDYVTSQFNTDRHDTRKILTLFGKLLFIFLVGVEKFSIKQIKFSAMDLTLGSAYEQIVKNKFLLERLNKLGYVYKGKLNNFFTFERK